MAMIECTECGRQVSDKAPVCLGCGAPVSSTKTATVSSGGAPAATVTPTVPKKSGRALPWLMALIGVVVFLVYHSSVGPSSRPSLATPEGLREVIRQPQKLVSERISLKEGQAEMYSFTLASSGRVEVKVNASPKDVDVMLMTADELKKFQAALGKAFGGRYTYRQALSRQKVLGMTASEVLPAGDWAIVIQRPVEGALFHDDTAASVDVTVY
jgi:hypothetical protein